jgi:hypothetical protein
MMTAAFLPCGRYQKRGSGFLFWLTCRIRLASRRCCSSACGTATLLRSIQSGCGSPEALPKNLSSERIGEKPSRSCVAQAGLPWRVWTMDVARSKVKAEADPLPDPRVVTAGFVVAVVALL